MRPRPASPPGFRSRIPRARRRARRLLVGLAILIGRCIPAAAAPPAPGMIEGDAVLADGRRIPVVIAASELAAGASAVRFAPRLGGGAFWAFGDTFQRSLFYGCTAGMPRLTGRELACPAGRAVLRPDVTLPDDPAAFPTSNVPVVRPDDRPVVQTPHFLAPWALPLGAAFLALLVAAVWLERRARRHPFAPPAPPPPRTSAAARWTLLGLTLLAAGLRLPGLGAEPFEQNEFTYFMSAFGHDSPLGVLMDVNGLAQTHPPLFHLVLWALRPLGVDEVVARLPAALAGVACAPLCFLLAWRLLRGHLGAATFAGLLCALSPVHLFYSQDVSPYTAMVLFACVVLLCAEAIVRDPGRRAPWRGLVLGTWGLCYTHYYGLHLSLACFAVLLVGGLRRAPGARALLLRTLSAGLAVVLGILPWLPAFVQGYLWSRGHSTAYQRLAGVYHPAANHAWDALDALRLVAGFPREAAALALVGVGLFLPHARLRALRRRHRVLLLAVVAWFVPFELLNRATFLHRLYDGWYFGIRYVLFLFPVAWVLAAACLRQALGAGVPRVVRWATVSLGVAAIALAVVEDVRLLWSPQKPDVLSATRLVADNLADGDALIVGPAAFYQHPVHYYLAPEAERAALRINDFMQTPAWQPGGWVGMLSGLFEPYERTLRSLHIRRVWVLDHTQHLFGRREFSDRPSAAIRTAVEARFQPVWDRHFHDTSVTLYTRRANTAPALPTLLRFGWNDGPFVRGLYPPWAQASPGRRVRPEAEVRLPIPAGQRIVGLRLRAGTMPPMGHKPVDDPAPSTTVLHVRVPGRAPVSLALEQRFATQDLPITSAPGATELRLRFELDRPPPGGPRPPEVVLDTLAVDLQPISE